MLKLTMILIFLIPEFIKANQNTNNINDSNLFLLLFPFLFLLMYILLIRPQTKKVNEHKKLIENLKINDEIATFGGIIGKIIKITDQFIIILVNKNIEIIIKKDAVVGFLPKGTMKQLK